MGKGMRAIGWAALAAVVAVPSAALPEALPPPPLEPGEVIGVTANGCALITVALGADAATFKAETRGSHWYGPCHNGLAHGAGILVYPALGPDKPTGSFRVEYFYGRTRYQYSRNDGTEFFMTSDGKLAVMSVDNDIDKPVFATWDEEKAGRHKSMVIVGDYSAFTGVGICPTYTPNCSSYQVYAPAPGNTFPGAQDCPGVTTTSGCEGLWRQVSGPVVARYRAARAQYESEGAPWRARLTQLNAAREARFAALDTSSGEAFARSQAAARADSDHADKDFKAKLAAANAGQLYAMADEFERAGDTEKAGLALRALLTRFPDHPLAVPAAQHLSNLPAPRATSGSCTAPEEEARLGASLKAAIGRIPASNPQWRYEAVMATTLQSAAAWSRCPTHPSSEAKVRNYRTAYVETARKCAMVSPSGACVAQMH